MSYTLHLIFLQTILFSTNLLRVEFIFEWAVLRVVFGEIFSSCFAKFESEERFTLVDKKKFCV